jgi:hypothetical protein
VILDLALDTLAHARLTRLVTTDVITEPMRGRVIEWAYNGRLVEWSGPRSDNDDSPDWIEIVAEDRDPPKLATLVTCQWCAGVWVAGAIALVRRRRWWKWVRVPLAMSMITGLLAENLE